MDAATRTDLLERYRAGHQLVTDALAKVGDDLDVRPADGGWTPRQVVHHLGDSEITSSIRLRKLLAEDDAVIIEYDEEAFAARLHYDRPIEPSLQAFAAARATNIALLEVMTEDEWQRSGTHSASGPYSVADWVAIYAAHARDHAEQILAAIGAA